MRSKLLLIMMLSVFTLFNMAEDPKPGKATIKGYGEIRDAPQGAIGFTCDDSNPNSCSVTFPLPL